MSERGWTVTLPGVTLRAFTPREVGGTRTFENDPGFEFTVELLSSILNSSSISVNRCELRVTAVGELDGVTVGCEGISGTITSTIQVAAHGSYVRFILKAKWLEYR